MTPERAAGESMVRPVTLSLPFTGRWLVQNSPARRVPSHGSDLFGERYAIDFVGVDDRGRTAAHRDLSTVFGTEPAERFFGFGRPVLAPAAGTVTTVHFGEEDHEARRSQFALVPYALGQAARVRSGRSAVAGNHLVIALPDGAGYVALVHLRAGSVRVSVGETVTLGQPMASCGNSGNSTQPHLHLQVMDSTDLSVAHGVPLVFRRYRESRGAADAVHRESGIPTEGAVVEPWPPVPTTGRKNEPRFIF